MEPRYDQIILNPEDSINHWEQILSPDESDTGTWIHQDAWFHLGTFEEGFTTEYSLKIPDNGIYIFLISGDIEVDGFTLHNRDGLGIQGSEKISITTTSPAKILIIEVPM